MSAVAGFRFVHAAALRLDAPFRDVGSVPADLAEIVRDASLRAWERLVQTTIDEGAAFLLLAGDLYEGPAVGLRAQVRFRNGLERLSERGIPVCVSRGGADRADAWSIVGEWPAGVTWFPEDAAGSVAVRRGDRVIATVHGRSGPPPRRVAQSTGRMRAGGAGFQIGLLSHDSSAAALGEPSGERIDYWALGGRAEHAIVGRDPWIVHAGTVQGRSFAPAELGTKGAMVVEVDDDRVRDVRLVPVGRVRLERLDVAVPPAGDDESLRRALGEEAERLRAAAPDTTLLIDAAVRGPAAGVRSDDLRARLTDGLRHEAEGAEPRLWWSRVRIEPDPGSGLRPDRLRDPLVAVLFEQADALQGAPLPRSSFLARRFEPLLSVWDAEIDLTQIHELVRDSAALAADLLSTEGADESA